MDNCEYTHLHFGEAFEFALTEGVKCMSCSFVIYQSGIIIPCVYQGHVEMGTGRMDAFKIANAGATCPMLLCGERMEYLYKDCGSSGDGESLAKELFPGVDAIADRRVVGVDSEETPEIVRRWLSDQLDAEARIVEILAQVEIARRLRYWVNRGG